MKPNLTRDNDVLDLVLTGTTANQIAVPVADKYQITYKTMVDSSGGALAPVAGDDATITVSVDGTSYNKPKAEAATVLDTELFEVITVSRHVSHIRAVMAGVAGTDVTTLTITCITDR